MQRLTVVVVVDQMIYLSAGAKNDGRRIFTEMKYYHKQVLNSHNKRKKKDKILFF